VSFGVIGLGLVHGSRQWTVAAVVAVLALVLLLITLGRRPVRPVESLPEPGRAGVALRD
jgi:UDP-GlcNAc:undecaprenyl-phosphate GlcNAc-1-phosphate transferase